MKTTREILSQRHAPATPQLDAIRRAVVQQLRSATPPARPWWQAFWREIFVAPRAIWGTIGLAWMAIFALQWTAANPATRSPVSTPRAFDSAFREQCDLLRIELGWSLPPAPRNPPARNLPPSGRYLRRPTGAPGSERV